MYVKNKSGLVTNQNQEELSKYQNQKKAIAKERSLNEAIESLQRSLSELRNDVNQIKQKFNV